MNQEQLAAAVSRLRQYEANPGNTPHEYSDSVMHEHPLALILDRCVLARAYLADHPPDDDEPLTKEWLRSVGFVSCHYSNAAYVEMLGSYGVRLMVMVSDRSNMAYIRDADYQSVQIQAPATRRDLRELCRKLGAEINKQGATK